MWLIGDVLHRSRPSQSDGTVAANTQPVNASKGRKQAPSPRPAQSRGDSVHGELHPKPDRIVFIAAAAA